jgi:hypothetical protein
MEHACNPSTQELQTGGLRVQGQPEKKKNLVLWHSNSLCLKEQKEHQSSINAFQGFCDMKQYITLFPHFKSCILKNESCYMQDT